MKIFFAILIALSLYGEDLALLYQSKGINAVIETLDKELTKKWYWNAKLKNIDTKYGYMQGKSSFLTCNKKSSTLSYYKRDKNGYFKEHNHFKALTGRIDGDKQTEGDNRTPIGIYKITKKLNKLDPFYGPLAFVTSYPNLYDKIRGKNGSGIWIHGVPSNKKRKKSTKGCIAINNSDILCLEESLDFKNTWLIIADNTNHKVSKNALSSILSQLYSWRYAWLKNHLNDYLSYYDKSFIRFDGMKYKKFVSYKKRIFAKKEKKKIFFTNVNVIPYPGKKSIFLISFHEKYHTFTYNFSGEKTLIAKLVNNKKMKIIAER